MKIVKKKLILASRQSHLARLQAYEVGEALQSLEPSLEIEYKFSASWGDRHSEVDLTSFETKGVFTQDLHQHLVNGEVDLVVHSWKDLPTEEEPSHGTKVIATRPRADMRDLFLIPKRELDVVRSRRVLEVFSSSPRREYNLKPLLPKIWPHELKNVIFKPIRGNIPTRLSKLFQEKGKGQGLVVAKAAVDRLLATDKSEFLEIKQKVRQFIDQSQWMVLPLCENPCAPAQGALAIEVAQKERQFKHHPQLALLETLNCKTTYKAASKERNILSNYGGGCHQKIGVSIFERNYGEILSLRGVTLKGHILKKWECSKKHSKPANPLSVSLKPCNPKNHKWFHRENLALENTHWHRPLWVSRETSLPLGSICHDLIWSSGMKTWHKLAQRGYWVHGSSESLGENEDPMLNHLTGGEVHWLKLTHKGAMDIGDKETYATYNLKSAKNTPTLSDETHFYWMSGSQFLEALRHYPHLKKAHHACGPGHTYKKIRSMLGDSAHVDIFLSRENWEEYISYISEYT